MTERGMSVEAAERFTRLEVEVGELKRNLDLAHSRIDKMQNLITDHVEKIHTGIEELTAFMNQMKGRRAALGVLVIIAAGAIGAITSAIINWKTGAP